MRIAHLSDLHALDLTGVRWTRFINKRLTGLVNLVGRRRDAHPLHLLDAVIDAVREAAVDHVVITGDVSNLALESEFAAVRERLERLGPPERVSLIPGNHDIYTRGAARARRFEHHFAPWLFEPGADPATAPYPTLKRPGEEIAIVGFRSAEPRAPLIATGRVTEDQLARFDMLVASGALAGRYPIALVHHNLHRRTWRKNLMHGLKDRDAFLGRLAAGGVRLLLHGHTHYAHRFESHGITIIGSGSSTWKSSDPAHVARFNVYTIEGGELVGTRVHRWEASAERFAPLAH
jgi:3',5'-cyclic AMP phosphodiesterase CpdA